MTVAIIGFGPRGLSGLENLILELSRIPEGKLKKVYVFETSEKIGTGKAWEINQPETNYINISDYALQNLKGREKIIVKNIEIPHFPSYSQWCVVNNKEENMDGDKDVYPPRFQMGKYLHERALSITEILKNEDLVAIIKEKVISVDLQKGKLSVTIKKKSFDVDECLIALGHTPVKDSAETKKYKKHDKENEVIYIHKPYSALIARDDLQNREVAIKGFGLSMLDITRQLTSYKFGTFQKKKKSDYLKFTPKAGCVKKIIPYSFDGLPCVPKPYGRKVDETFAPSITQNNIFELQLRNALAAPKKIKTIDFLLDAFANVAVEIYLANMETAASKESISNVIIRWLKDTTTSHKLILDIKLPALDYMKHTVKMAWGTEDASLDYTTGQVWRHLQPVMYRVFAFCGISSEVMKSIIDMDQRTKRYSFGPPVESILQLIALHEAGILDLSLVNDPDVEVINKGWKITKNESSSTLGMLCNSVMDDPVLKKFDSSIITSLNNQELIQSVHDELGILTRADGTVIPPKTTANKIPIAVVGRNAKGSVLGTDAIRECFSPETHNWAKGIILRS